MRPLSVDKLNIVISRLHSGQTTCQISSSTGISIGTISKIHSEHCSDPPKSSSGYPVKLSPANVCHAVNFITSGKAETVVQVSKSGWKGPHPFCKLLLKVHWRVFGTCTSCNLFSALKASQSFSNSDLRHLQHYLDSNHVRYHISYFRNKYARHIYYSKICDILHV